MHSYPPRPTYPPKPWQDRLSSSTPKRPAHLSSGAHVGGRPAMLHSDLDDKVYAAIVAYAGEHGGNTPTMRELVEECHISSTSVVAYHIHRLINQGMLEVVDRKLIVVGGTWTPPAKGD